MRRILVLGAGQTAPYLVHRLLEDAGDQEWEVVVGDVDPESAARCVAGHPRGKAVPFDVNHEADRDRYIREADLVINFLSPVFQDLVAWDCVARGRHMLSVSYRDQAVRDLDADARGKGVLLLCELGLDPGIDHMSAMELIDEVRGRGGRITGFRSYGSGVPAPGPGMNPLRYVVTWNPRNVVMSGEYGAQYMENGRIKIVPHHHIFHHTWLVDVDGVGLMEAYPNRDSLSYMESFGLEGVESMIRGTLRYPGWSETWAQIVALGLPNETLRIPDLARRSYREVVEMFLPLNTTGPGVEQRVAKFLGISPTGRIMENLGWLGLFSEEPTGCEGDTAARMMIDLLRRKLPLGPKDADLVILVHELEARFGGDGDRRERITSTLVERGTPGGFTAMSRTVGLPTASAAKLVLNGEIDLAGSRIPTEPPIYRPILEDLASAGLVLERKAIRLD